MAAGDTSMTEDEARAVVKLHDTVLSVATPIYVAILKREITKVYGNEITTNPSSQAAAAVLLAQELMAECHDKTVRPATDDAEKTL